MTKHTAGPWKAEAFGAVTTLVQGIRRQVASTVGDAVMHSDPRTNVVDLQAANARLIAAAPEMLKCLEACLGELESAFGGPQDQNEEEAALLAQARAAIAKAKGEA